MAMELASTNPVVALEETPSTSSSMNPEAKEGTINVHEKVLVLAIKTQLEMIISSGGTDANLGLLSLLIQKLDQLPMNLDILSSTLIGRTINQLKKNTKNQEVSSQASSLIKKWKNLLYLEEEKDKEEEESSSTTSNATSIKKDTKPQTKVRRKLEETSGDTPPKLVNSANQTACCPPMVTTTDAVRLKCRQLLLQAIQRDGNLPDETYDPDYLAEQLEHHIFQEFKSTEAKYRTRVFSRVANLKDVKNPNLRLNLLLGELTPARLAKMTHEEMASEDLKIIDVLKL